MKMETETMSVSLGNCPQNALGSSLNALECPVSRYEGNSIISLERMDYRATRRG
jgi:hypothetical protein